MTPVQEEKLGLIKQWIDLNIAYEKTNIEIHRQRMEALEREKKMFDIIGQLDPDFITGYKIMRSNEPTELESHKK